MRKTATVAVSAQVRRKGHKVTAQKSRGRRRKKVYYLLPLEWSLHYVMSDGEWRDFRIRVKEVIPNWETCNCPNGCQANTLDEIWDYDKRKHVKRFVKAQFICPGCHWLKSPGWRVQTWLKDESGFWTPPERTPHIFDCLGWTKRRVRQMRRADLEMYYEQLMLQDKREKEVKTGEATEVSWTADLSGLKKYGYSEIEISYFSSLMFLKARGKI